MSLPRQVLPGQSYFMSRRCTQRQFLMRPDPETNNAFIYCLGEAAQRFGISLYFVIANSNHHHTGGRDVHGNYPAFLEHFHKMFAKCQNALRGRWENFWASEQVSVVRLVDADDTLSKMVYALANPVKDQLVEKAHHWPGVSSLDALLHGKPLTAKRPRHFFREDGPMPEEVTITFVRPPGLEHLSQEEFAALVLKGIEDVEKAAARERASTGRRILGRRAVLRQDWRESPASREPRRRLSPRVAARNKWSRIEALLRNKAFLDAYRKARDAFLRGVAGVLFPAGTYWLRRFARAPCEPPPAPA